MPKIFVQRPRKGLLQLRAGDGNMPRLARSEAHSECSGQGRSESPARFATVRENLCGSKLPRAVVCQGNPLKMQAGSICPNCDAAIRV
jgi:hypothetical protein